MSPRAWLEMNPRDARKLGLRPHELVDIESRRNRVRGVELRVTEIVAPGHEYMPFHFVETNSNLVTQRAYSPTAREPNFKKGGVKGVTAEVQNSGAQDWEG